MVAQQQDLEPENRCVFHGTAREFISFDPAFLGTGGDCNSALGFHFTDNPYDAAEYADTHAGREGGEARVLVVRAATVNPTADLDYYAFFGYDDNGDQVRDHEGFAALRRELLAKGHDGVVYADNEQDIFVVLDPAKIEVVASLTVDEAERLGEKLNALPDREDDEARFRMVDEILSERVAPMGPA